MSNQLVTMHCVNDSCENYAGFEIAWIQPDLYGDHPSPGYLQQDYCPVCQEGLENGYEHANRTSTLSDAEQAAYKANATRCPACGSSNLHGYSFDVEGGSAYQPIDCRDCGSSWVDAYRFDRIAHEELTR